MVIFNSKVNFGHKNLFKSTIAAFLQTCQCQSSLILKLKIEKRKTEKANLSAESMAFKNKTQVGKKNLFCLKAINSKYKRNHSRMVSNLGFYKQMGAIYVEHSKSGAFLLPVLLQSKLQESPSKFVELKLEFS